MKYQNIFLLALMFFVASCGKDDSDELLTEIPTIELVNVVPESNQVQQYTDELIFTISYSDGDGDLGTEDPDIPSIELVDMRDPDVLKFEYHLSPRAPSGSEIKITGELNVVLNHTIIIDENNDTEMTTFKIRIKDQAGNWSNEVETGVMMVSK
ncbi:MAG: hypothetical protein AB8H03_04895 [Saprospiraceae bacterium]